MSRMVRKVIPPGMDPRSVFSILFFTAASLGVVCFGVGAVTGSGSICYFLLGSYCFDSFSRRALFSGVLIHSFSCWHSNFPLLATGGYCSLAGLLHATELSEIQSNRTFKSIHFQEFSVRQHFDLPRNQVVGSVSNSMSILRRPSQESSLKGIGNVQKMSLW